jgi:hypothetical protein
MEVQTQPSKHKIKVTLMLHSNDKIIKHKVGLLNLADELGNVSKACQIMGLTGSPDEGFAIAIGLSVQPKTIVMIPNAYALRHAEPFKRHDTPSSLGVALRSPEDPELQAIDFISIVLSRALKGLKRFCRMRRDALLLHVPQSPPPGTTPYL